MIHKNCGYRRRATSIKAKRKAKIWREIIDWDVPVLGYFRKSRFNFTSAKTNDKAIKSRGPVDGNRSGRIATTHMRYGKKNWKLSDRRKVDSMNYRLAE